MTALTIRIDWSEQDLYGHVNNVSYFKYQQAARVNFWEAIGLIAVGAGQSAGPMLAEAGIRFLKPLHYPGSIRIETVVSFLGNTSFGLEHMMYNENNELCASGKDAVVLFDYNKMEKMPISTSLRELLETHLAAASK